MPRPPAADGLRYRAYGLTLDSDTPLPELPAVAHARAAAVRVRLGGGPSRARPRGRWFMAWEAPTGARWLSCARRRDGYLLRFSDLADFSVDPDGREIVCRAGAAVSRDTLRHLLLDQVLPLVLNLRGRDALHATAVLTPAGVSVFTGPTGAGKSTLAASFLLAGYPVLSDDCLILGEDGGRIVATPAYPGVRLWRDALAALGRPRARARSGRVAHYTSKQRLRPPADGPHPGAARYPVARIYALVPPAGAAGVGRSAPRIERLSRRDGFAELIASAFRLDITDRAMLARQFRLLTRVAARVPIRRLRAPHDFAALPAVRASILADLGVR